MGDSTPLESDKTVDQNQTDNVEKNSKSNGEQADTNPEQEPALSKENIESPKEPEAPATESTEDISDKEPTNRGTRKTIKESHDEKASEAKTNQLTDETSQTQDTPMETSVDRVTRGKKRKLEDAKEVIEGETESQDSTNANESKDEDGSSKDKAEDQDADMNISNTEPMGKGKRARIPNKRYSDIVLASGGRKSVGHSSAPTNTTLPNEIEQKEVHAKEEVHIKEIKEEVASYVSEDVASISVKKTKAPSTSSVSDPKYLKPLDMGWKRELVWRATTSNTKRQGDIYYYTPTGKKVRSFREVSENLKGSNKKLTLDNFTFVKESLGINDPSKEIIRDAKFKVVGLPATPKPVSKGLPEKRTPIKSVMTPKLTTPSTPIIKTKIGQKTPITKNSKNMKSTKKTPKTEETPMEVEKPVVKSTPVRKAAKAKQVTESAPSKPKSRNLKLSNITNSSSANPEERSETRFMENYLQNLSFGYNTLLYVFQYLKVQDLLRAGCVCTMWRDIASHPILWRTVRMKNSQVHSFEGLANTLKKHGTRHLDLRKMLLPNSGDEIWPEFSKAIARVDTLSKIELCRCPASVVEQLAESNPSLEVINAVTIRCESMNLDPLKSLRNIKELRLKSTSGLTVPSIDSLEYLITLQQLSLTSVNELHKLNLNVLEKLVNLKVLELGECVDFPKSFGENILGKLDNLEKLRLEKGQGNCHTFEILTAVKDMPNLEQLELVNFDVKNGFDKALGACSNIKKLMIIPTYISQSATTNNMVLSGVLRLQKSLTHFVWGVTLELLRVTELFVDQCEDPKEKKEKKPTGNGDSIPVLKPVPDLSNSTHIAQASNPPQVEILPLPNLQKLLLNSLPTTRVKILKIPFHATWRQTLTDSV